MQPVFVLSVNRLNDRLPWVRVPGGHEDRGPIEKCKLESHLCRHASFVLPLRFDGHQFRRVRRLGKATTRTVVSKFETPSSAAYRVRRGMPDSGFLVSAAASLAAG